MSPCKQVFTVLFATFMAGAPAFAQDASHPMLSSSFELQVGAFFPDEGLKIQADTGGTDLGDLVDFNRTLGVDESDSTLAAELRWRFGEKWSVWGQYWASKVTGRRTLTEDLSWRDFTLEAGSFLEAGVDTTVTRVFFGRTFSTSAQHEFGAGLGFHWLEIGAYVEGDFRTSAGDVVARRDGVDAGAPLPNIGAWYIYAPSDRWAFQARGDWLSASFDEYSGDLYNFGLSANYQFTDHFGLGLSYNYFRIDVDVDNDGWDGSAEISQRGPFASAIFNW